MRKSVEEKSLPPKIGYFSEHTEMVEDYFEQSDLPCFDKVSVTQK